MRRIFLRYIIIPILACGACVEGFETTTNTIRKVNSQLLQQLPFTGTTESRSSTSIIGNAFTNTRKRIILNQVSEEDVYEAVSNAEELWAKALEARKTANALSDRAEEEAEAAAVSAKDVDEMFKTMDSISVEKIAQADKAAKSSMDAGSMVSRALDASDEADRLEALAEEALRVSEQRLEQHVKDFPDSPLAS